jgi:DMSO/TMAO reductase YedYZ molybdopterin-dependent catalytic subunit
MQPVSVNPTGTYRRIPLAPHQMRDRLTRTEDAIVLCHVGLPHLARDDWSLTIDGLVQHPMTLHFDDLRRYQNCEITSVHQCAGNPMQPLEPTQRVCNVRWSGIRLGDVLSKSQPKPEARYIWSSGADCGVFGGMAIQPYTKDLPLERVREDVLIATEMNGALLKREHGFPARLIVPGFYGTNSVKWLTRITLASTRAASPMTTRRYNDPVLDSSGNDTGQTVPVWAIAPQSIIVSMEPGSHVRAGVEHEVWGWAWADGGVSDVTVSFDAGATWSAAELEAPHGREWQRFSLLWMPGSLGLTNVVSLATSREGVRQPLSGQRRNAAYRVVVQVI